MLIEGKVTGQVILRFLFHVKPSVN